MVEEKIEINPELEEEKKSSSRAAKGGRRRGRGRRKAKAAKAALQAEKKPAKKARKKAAAKRGKRRGRKTAAKAGKPAAAPRAPGIPADVLMPPGGDVQPIWYQYAFNPPMPVTKRPSIPTEVKTGNVVAWLTDSGRDRCGVVCGFQDDAALIDVGDRMESIRLSRITVIALKQKK